MISIYVGFHFAACRLIIQMGKWHASSPFLLLLLLIPSCSSKEVSIFHPHTAAFKIGRLKVEFKSCASANEILYPAFSCSLARSRSFWSYNYSPAGFWSEPNHRWTVRPPLWTWFIFDEKDKLFVMLCCLYLVRFVILSTSCFSSSICLCRGQHF